MRDHSADESGASTSLELRGASIGRPLTRISSGCVEQDVYTAGQSVRTNCDRYRGHSVSSMGGAASRLRRLFWYWRRAVYMCLANACSFALGRER